MRSTQINYKYSLLQYNVVMEYRQTHTFIESKISHLSAQLLKLKNEVNCEAKGDNFGTAMEQIRTCSLPFNFLLSRDNVCVPVFMCN